MTHDGNNKGIRVLDDFQCKAILGSDVLKADGQCQGRNEGMQIIEEPEIGAAVAKPQRRKMP